MFRSVFFNDNHNVLFARTHLHTACADCRLFCLWNFILQQECTFCFLYSLSLLISLVILEIFGAANMTCCFINGLIESVILVEFMVNPLQHKWNHEKFYCLKWLNINHLFSSNAILHLSKKEEHSFA